MSTSSSQVLVDAFSRVRGVVATVLEGATADELDHRMTPRSNTIAWLIWHLTRIQDDHVAGVAGSEQVWTGQGWVHRLGLALDPSDTGFAHSPQEVALVKASAEDLLGYHEAVHQQTVAYVSQLHDEDLQRIIDTRWNPPVSALVRLVSVISDDLQHAGQAAFIRGLLRGD